MARELRQDGKDKASLGMTPPRGAKRLTREDADHVRDNLVLLEEKFIFSECRQNEISCVHAKTLY
jgi:hypothetical protein